MRKKPAPYTKQKTTPRGSNRETKRTIEKRTKTNNRKQRENNRKAIVGYTSFPSATQASRKLDKLSNGLDNIPEVAGNLKNEAGRRPA